MGERGDDFMAPMELEHAMGFTGRYSHSLVYHPTDAGTDVVVYPIGKLLVFADMNDPHKQIILRGHDNEITAVDVSQSGKFICSAQTPLPAGDGYGNIYIWDYENRLPIYVLQAHRATVLGVAFSDDDRWLASVGEDGRVIIWDMETGTQAGGCQEHVNINNRSPAKWVAWGPMENLTTRRPKYTLCVGYEKEVRSCIWEFNIKSMIFMISQTPCQVPGSGGGLSRYYNCGCISSDGLYCLAGTTSGDLVIYNVKNAVFRNTLPMGANVLSCMFVDATTCMVGTGDGTLKVVVGQDREWKVVRELKLLGGITNITLSGDKQEVVVGTNVGVMYRVLTSDTSCTTLMQSHVSMVRCAVFPNQRSDMFVSCGDDGFVRQWDLSHYNQISSFSFNVNQHKLMPSTVPLCAIYTPNDAHVLTGWSDGYIRCLDLMSPQGFIAWEVVNAHKGAVNVISSATQYFCTAGEDCAIRVWSQQNHECLIQIQENKRPITGIIIDNTTESIIHTVSLDKNLFTYDVYKSDVAKGAKRLTYHCDTEGLGFNAVTQRIDNEHECVVATCDGRLLVYDIDYPTPTLVVSDPLRTRINTVAVSPSGTHMACGNAEGKLHLYDLRQSPPRLLGQAWLHSNDIMCLKWSPDGKQLITAGHDSALCIWNFYANDQ
mmetsp:Transcript_44839/g.80343  ORF Transcript_44839/g.80343 Transcript_44839/m.80343 type:complete len:658 (-) Transcript_44839:933-2906(-)